MKPQNHTQEYMRLIARQMYEERTIALDAKKRAAEAWTKNFGRK